MGDLIALSIDIGSTLGWALGKNGVILSSGEVSLNAKEAHPGRRWLKFQEWLHQHKDVHEIYCEDVQGMRSTDAAKVFGALSAFIQLHCLVQGIRLRMLKPQTVKMEFTGRGNANKFQMCDVAMDLGWRAGKRETDFNHNEADAIALYWVMCSRFGIPPSFTR